MSKQKIDWINKRFGRLVVQEEIIPRKAKCLCDCGTVTIVFRDNLARGNTTSCGCAWREKMSEPRKHGHANKAGNSLTYNSWASMKARCSDKNQKIYPYYGGRGIRVCVAWQKSFSSFLRDMGERPSRLHTLDRTDNNKGYNKNNCKWATKKEQANNRRKRGTCL